MRVEVGNSCSFQLLSLNIIRIIELSASILNNTLKKPTAMHIILCIENQNIILYEIYIYIFTLLSHNYYNGRYAIEIFMVIDNNDNIYRCIK